MSTPTRTHPIACLAPRLRRQHGVLTTEQAAADGVDQRQLLHLVTTGLVERRHRGVYVQVGSADTWHQQVLIAQYAAGPHAAVSHLAAARLLGLTHLGSGWPPVTITVTRGKRREHGPSVRTSTAFRVARDTVMIGPFRVTHVRWTLCALGAEVHPEKLQRSYDAAIAAGRITIDELDEDLLRWAFVPGVVNARAALADLLPEFRGTRSDGERRFLRMNRAVDLPIPEANVRVIDARGRVRYLDFAWERWSVSVEIDIHPDHDGTLGRRKDGHRQNDLVDRWTVLRFDAHDLFVEPHVVAATVRRALRAAGADI